MDIRLAEPDDATALSALRRAVYSYSVMSPASARHMITVRTPGEKCLQLVAVADDEVVGWGATGLNTWTSEPGHAWVAIYVHPGHRRQGIGGALSDRVHEHLGGIGAQRARIFADADAVDFAVRHGYEASRQMHYAGADPRNLPEQPSTPADIRLAGLDEVDPRQAYTADTIASLDEPGDAPMDAVSYEDWLKDVWEAPGLDKGLSVAAMAGDEMVAFTAVETDVDRAWAGMTGTVPAYRGRGLAKLVKSVALRRCAAAGITGAYTSNDDSNGPMLAINNWLGYRRIATQTGLVRPL
ncbi:putative N-acetyltransferase YhbS [Kribbella amoyensis]|uniref:Putative N-acetyltransferase YhbS n=1 Tax=Kribbella amoyensis TaxID=996641 RepID=A0A561BV26_9ACTN|nr:GNAT family N-acetyltransferase [Kribbella amoyensis]TWD82708.1 putative N-acetyltransferase YhbS [Kribbella amoyensis]